MAADSLNRAIELIRSGRGKEAKGILQRLIKEDLHNIPAWFWYTETCSTSEQRIRILEACTQYNPDNAQVQRALESLLKASPASSAPAVTASMPVPEAARPAAAPGPTPPLSGNHPALQTPSSLPHVAPRVNKTKSKPFSVTAGLAWTLACLLVLGLGGLGYHAWSSRPRDPSAYRHTQPIEYYLYVPSAYKPDGTWPLFIGIHGTGGSGLDCWNLWQTYADWQGFVLLCPSLADSSGGWYQTDGENKLWASISQVQSQYPVAPRFFLAGFSAGAQFVQGFSFDYPGAVQAAAVLSAGNYYPPTPAVAGMSFLVVIGDQDDPAAVQTSQLFATSLAQAGAGVDYWLLPGVGHQVTDKTRQLTVDFFRKAYGK